MRSGWALDGTVVNENFMDYLKSQTLSRRQISDTLESKIYRGDKFLDSSGTINFGHLWGQKFIVAINFGRSDKF